MAIKESFSSIAASAATTVFGFLALIFMRFGIGSDLGLNLVKGVTLSYISVMVFLPALALACMKLMDKTHHKRIIPELGAWAACSSRCASRRSSWSFSSSYPASWGRAALTSSTAWATPTPACSTARTPSL